MQVPFWKRNGVRIAAALIVYALLSGYAINAKSESTAKKAARNTTAQINTQARASAWEAYDADFASCQRGNAGRRDSIERDRDIKNFADQAAAARRADGDIAVAEGYEKIARRAFKRQARSEARILPCKDIVPEPPYERPRTARDSQGLLKTD